MRYTTCALALIASIAAISEVRDAGGIVFAVLAGALIVASAILQHPHERQRLVEAARKAERIRDLPSARSPTP